MRIILLSYPGKISCLQFRRTAIGGCSQFLESVKEGFSCPVNKSEWDARAQAMHCEMYSQNCTDKSSFVYHCLINPWSNGTIEVCAPRVKILGKKCAEFNIGGKLVQSHYQKPCQLCPYRYNSSESYKYQECYKLAKKPELTAMQASSSKELTYNIIGGKPNNVSYSRNHKQKPGSGYEENDILFIAPVCVMIIVIIILALILNRKIRQTKRKPIDNERQNDLSNKVDEERIPCLNGNTNPTEHETDENHLKKTDEERPTSSKVSIEGGVLQNPLHMRSHFLEDICKMENCEGGMDVLMKKILQSPYFKIYNEYMSKTSFQGRSVTGNWREDIGIKAAAVIFSMKIYLYQSNENKTTVFFPKDSDTAKWMSISVDEEGNYNHLSDWTTINKDEAKLMFDEEYEIPDILLKEDVPSKSNSITG